MSLVFALVPLIFCVLGFLLWWKAKSPLIKRVGEYFFAIGLFFLVWTMTNYVGGDIQFSATATHRK
jgi:hypothetical protein